MSQELPFEPFPFIEDPHQQTLFGTFCHLVKEPTSTCKIVTLDDEDKIALEITTPTNWMPHDFTVVMVHGLCGSHLSHYLVRLAGELLEHNIRSVRVNMRGCGSGEGMAKYMYHGGRSEDVFEVIKVLKLEHPHSPILLIGFSLGGNIVLKMAGELGSLATDFLVGVIGVSPPVDLRASAHLLGLEGNAMYERYFLGKMCENVHYRHEKFKDLPPVRLPKGLKIHEFDQIYTAPFYGFRDAHDYYDKCSSLFVIPDIAIPCKILFSEDDPIVDSSSLDGISLPSNIQVFTTKKGGHMGYLAHPTKERGVYWLNLLLIDWIAEWKKNLF